MAYKGFKKIIDNRIENMYLYILSFIKDKNETLDIIYRVFDRIFTVDYHMDSLLKIRDKIEKYINYFIKNYLNKNSSIIDKISIESYDFYIPEELYVLDYNLSVLFDDVDNQIIHGILIYENELNELASLLNFNEDFIYERYKVILRYMRIQYLQHIRKIEIV